MASSFPVSQGIRCRPPGGRLAPLQDVSALYRTAAASRHYPGDPNRNRQAIPRHDAVSGLPEYSSFGTGEEDQACRNAGLAGGRVYPSLAVTAQYEVARPHVALIPG